MTLSLMRYAIHTVAGHPGHEKFWRSVEEMLTPEQRQRLGNGGDIRESTWLTPAIRPAAQGPGAQGPGEREIVACRPLLDLIYRHEAGGFASPYEAYNRGSAGDSLGKPWPGGLQNLTIAEIKALQQAGKLFAVGAPQMVPSTLLEQQPRAGLSDADLFSAANQDRLTTAILLQGKRPMLARFLLHGTNQAAAIDDLAFEWASLPNSQGKGWYDGDNGGNKAHGSLAAVIGALQASRARLISPAKA
jgi:hypothetical protein